MSNYERLLHKIRNNPKDVRLEELVKLLEWSGCEIRKGGRSGHDVACKGAAQFTIPRPHKGRKCREHYVRDALTTFGLWDDEGEEG